MTSVHVMQITVCIDACSAYVRTVDAGAAYIHVLCTPYCIAPHAQCTINNNVNVVRFVAQAGVNL